MRSPSKPDPARCAAIALAGLAGCVVPPPLALPFEGSARDPVGSTSAGGFVSYAGDYTSAISLGAPAPPDGGPATPSPLPSVVADLRVGHQAARNASVAVDVGGGSAFSNGGSANVFLGRAHLRIHPDSDHFAFTLGAGGGALWSSGSNPAIGVFTLDAGFRVGFSTRYLDGFAAQTLSMTAVPSQNASSSASAIPFWVSDLGLVVKPVPRFGIGAGLSMLLPFNDHGSTNRPYFVPSLSFRYVFGGTSSQ